MGKKVIRFSEWYDNENDENYSASVQEKRERKKQKRINRALKTLDVDSLLEMEDYD